MTSRTPAIVRRELEPTHPCIRCGREGVPADAGLCELCNPLELSQPSATQMHGIAAVGILGFILLLALIAAIVANATGPFVSSVVGVEPAEGGLAVTLRITNEGSNATATTCVLREVRTGLGARTASVQTPRIASGETLTLTRVLTQFGTEPLTLSVDCGNR
ncbi:MAG TPA: hypothetical protein VNL94_03770 [Candidatus Binatia bacterium]|nr:hypothetical protein [Candidatus Binatia bacterium]